MRPMNRNHRLPARGTLLTAVKELMNFEDFPLVRGNSCWIGKFRSEPRNYGRDKTTIDSSVGTAKRCSAGQKIKE
jgi:hypothetical protein